MNSNTTIAFVLLGLVLVIIETANAQVTVHGTVRAGANRTTVQGQRLSGGYTWVAERTPSTGFVAGAGVVIEGPRWIGAEADLLFSQKGVVKTMGDDQQQTWQERSRINYLEIPLLIQVRPIASETIVPYLQGGFAPSIRIGGNVESTDRVCLSCTHADYGAADLGIVLGAGARSERLGPTVSVDLRYTRGLITVRTSRGLGRSESGKNEAISLMVGLWF